MKLGIFAKTFPGTTPFEVLEAAVKAGYAVVQYNMACSGIGALPERISAEVMDAVKTASETTGVDIVAISATYNMINPDLAAREAGRRSFEAIASVVRSLGCNLLTVCSGSCDPDDQWRDHPDNQSPAAWNEMCAEFRKLVAIADRYDVLIGVEPELANVVNSADKARALIDTIGSDRIRIVFDPANLFEIADPSERRTVIEEAIKLLADRIEIAHAKDRHADGTFATAGKGVIDYDHYIGALRKAGFNGALITHGLGATEAKGVAEFLTAALGSKVSA